MAINNKPVASAGIKLYVDDKEIKLSNQALRRAIREQSTALSKLEKSHPDYKARSKDVARLKAAYQDLNQEQRDLVKSYRKTNSTFNKQGSILKGLPSLVAGAFAVGTLISWGKQLIDNVNVLRDVRHEIKNLSSQSKASLNVITSKSQSIADVYKKDVKETAVIAEKLASTFNIQTSQALDLINQGFLAGADASGEFFSQIKEYPAIMKEAGLNAKEFIGLITQAEKQNVYADKAIDSIKEGFLSLREGGKATKEALNNIGVDVDDLYNRLNSGQTTYFEGLKEVSKKIEETGNQSTYTGQAIADIFRGAGEDAGFNFLSTLHSVNLEMEDLIDWSDEYTRLKNEEYEVNARLNAQMLEMSRTGGVFQQAMVWGKEKLAEFLEGVQDTYKFIQTVGFWKWAKIDFNPADKKRYNNLYNSFRKLKNEALASEKPLKSVSRLLRDLKNQQAEIKIKEGNGSSAFKILTNQIRELEGVQKEIHDENIKRASQRAAKKKERAKKDADRKRILTEQELKQKAKSEARKAEIEERVAQIRKEKSLKSLEKLKKDIKKAQHKIFDAKLSAIEDGYLREAAAEVERHKRAVKALEAQKKDLTGIEKEDVAEYLKLIDAKIEKENELHRVKGQAIEQKYRKKTTQSQTPTDNSGWSNGIDIFGSSPEEWQATLNSLTDLSDMENWANSVQQTLSGVANAWGMYYDYLNSRDQQSFSDLEKQTDKKKKTLQDQLDKGLINQDQYNRKLEKLEKNLEKERSKIEYNRAKREQTMALFQIASNTASGIMKAVAALPATGGMPWTAIIAGMGLAQAGAVLKAPLPDKGYYYGGFTGNKGFTHDNLGPVTGYVHANEYVIPSGLLNTPEISNVVNNIENVRTGQSDSITEPSPNPELIKSINMMNAFLQYLTENGVQSSMNWGYSETKKLTEQQERINKIKTK